MAKKSSFNLFYLIGMIAVVVGSFLPIIRISLGILGKIDFTIVDAFKDLSNLDSWLALLMFVAAAIGIILCFVIGAVIGNFAIQLLHEKAILCCSVLLVLSFIMMFIDYEKGQNSIF